MKNRIEEYTAGAGPPSSRLVGTAVVVSPGLGCDRQTIPADSSTPATFHYQRRNAETSVLVTVNGAPQTLQLDASGAVEFEVTASVPGPVDVSANGDTLTIQAV